LRELTRQGKRGREHAENEPERTLERIGHRALDSAAVRALSTRRAAGPVGSGRRAEARARHAGCERFPPELSIVHRHRRHRVGSPSHRKAPDDVEDVVLLGQDTGDADRGHPHDQACAKHP